MVPSRFPFSIAEELMLAENPSEPPTVQTELALPGCLDEARLSEAFSTALALHPMARARKVADRHRFRPPEWEIAEVDRLDLSRIVQVVDCECEQDLAAVRDAHFSRLIPLDGPIPAVRLLLVRHRMGQGTSLMLAMHHAIADGVGSLRLLRSIARAYTGRPDPIPNIDPIAARDVRNWPEPQRSGRRRPVRRDGLRAPRSEFVASLRGEPAAAGYGFAHRVLTAEESAQLDPRRHTPGATINDLLLASLHRAIGRWNASLGAEAERIAVMMPINTRPPAWRTEVVANLIFVGRVSTDAAERDDAGRLMATVSEQTAFLKQRGLPVARLLPGWLLYSRLLMRPALLRRFSVTTVLSNVGRLGEVADFGPEAGPATAFLKAPPAGDPAGISVGAATVNGRLNLTVRYRRTRFDSAAGRQFLDAIVDEILYLGGVASGSGRPYAEPVTAHLSLR